MIECEPTASVLVMNNAWPELFRVPVPRVLGPSLKVTVPVGVPAPGLFAFTVAVKVTACPDTEWRSEEVRPVVVPGSVVVVVDVDVVVEVVVVGAVVVEVVDVVVVVERRVVVEVVVVGAIVVEVVDVVVVVGDRVVVEEAVTMGRKVARTMCQVSVVPKVRLPCCGPVAQDRISSRSAEALPYRTSRT